jgi:SAM-dependent methyltransferase
MAEDKEKSAAAVDYRKLGKDVFEFFTHRTAYNSAAYLIPTLERMKQENPRLRLLDVGAGAGSVSATFAQIIGPEGHVVCTDLAPSVLPQAEAFAESLGVKNIEFKTADVHQLPFKNDSFDVVHCHQLFGHIKDPVAALLEMLRVTKPGGVVAAREGDRETEIIWPPLPGLKKWHEYVSWPVSVICLLSRDCGCFDIADLRVSFDSKVAQVHGGTLTAGRQLLAWALEAGVKRNQIEVSYGTWLTSEEATKLVYGMLGYSSSKLGVNVPDWDDETDLKVF